MGKCKTKTCASIAAASGFVYAEKRLKNFLLHILGNPDACIAYINAQPCIPG